MHTLLVLGFDGSQYVQEHIITPLPENGVHDVDIGDTDNEGANVYPDGAVVVLYGDGAAKTLFRDPDFEKYGYSIDVDEEEIIDVGPNSRHPKLQKLEY